MSEKPHEAGFTPINPNPFIVGNPVRGRAMFFGREAEFELVRRRFQHAGAPDASGRGPLGGLMVFCGERRSGKTSILFQILDGRLGADFVPVLIDMQSMAVGNEVEFLTRVSQEIRDALGSEGESIPLPVFGGDASHSSTFQKFILDVLRARPTKKLILLFDEYELFENKIDAGLLSRDVLNILANLMENRPVFLIFTGSQHLEQRRRDYYRMLLTKSQHKMISFLEHADSLNLIRKPVEGRVHYAEGVVESIWRLAAGQPFYTQAICQSLVDSLNERRSNHATAEGLSSVVDGLVNNPLPQMIFLWDGLDRDEKLVLALLAEQLADSDAHAEAEELIRLLRRRQYPLDLEMARVATALEKLFKHEMLLRRDRGNEREYAFRMDLWRLWIRRQHSVWQVMREEGLEIRPSIRHSVRRAFAILAALAVAALVTSLVFSAIRGRSRPRNSPTPLGPIATFALVVTPQDATISLNGQTIGFGRYRGQLEPGHDHVFRVTAPGYADSEIVVNLASGANDSHVLALRERRGDLRIETQPSGAEVKVDGVAAGRSPLTVRGLTSARPHQVVATLTGHGQAAKEVSIAPEKVTSTQLALATEKVGVMVTTEPPGADVRVDHGAAGRSPLSLKSLAPGPHGFSVSRDGYLQAETTLTVVAGMAPIQIALLPEPPGYLVVKGDRLAVIWIGGALAVANVQNSGVRELPPGTHPVHIVFANGDTLDHSVSIRSGERATYDYSNGTVTRSPARKP